MELRLILSLNKLGQSVVSLRVHDILCLRRDCFVASQETGSSQ